MRGVIISLSNQSLLGYSVSIISSVINCFIAKQIGIKGEPNFTEKELREQFSIVWVSDIHAAISLLEQDLPTNYEGKFIQRRDLTSLKTARDQMSM